MDFHVSNFTGLSIGIHDDTLQSTTYADSCLWPYEIQYLKIYRLRSNQEVVSIVPIHKWSFCPISALCSKNNPRNIKHMPAVIFFACLDLEQKSSFPDGH